MCLKASSEFLKEKFPFLRKTFTMKLKTDPNCFKVKLNIKSRLFKTFLGLDVKCCGSVRISSNVQITISMLPNIFVLYIVRSIYV